MRFSCNPQVRFVIFSQFELGHFWLHIGTGYLVNATPPTLLDTLQVFC